MWLESIQKWDYQAVLDLWTVRVHIGWDMCPTQQQNMYKGKEGYPSVAYEVICT